MRFRLFDSFVATVTLFGVAVLAHGQGSGPQGSRTFSPVGRWKTVDDVTGKINSVVDIWEENSKLYGKIERLINPDPKDPDPRCVRCSGDLKDRRLIGLRIFWDLTKALKIFGSNDIDLVVSDHHLPGLSGAETASRMKRARPNLPILLLSGVPDLPEGTGNMDRFIKAEGPEKLLQTVAELLRYST